MVEFENVAFAHGGTEVLRDAGLAVASGAFCVVVGRAGAGKTTLLRLVRGEIAPQAGTVRVLGRPVPARDRRARAALRRRIGSVDRSPRFLERLTVIGNVALPLVAQGVDPATRMDDLDDLLAWVGLAGQAGTRPGALAAAGRRRAAVARAVAGSPDIVLADEPAAGLDPAEAIAITTLLLQLNAMGKTVVLATADGDLVEYLSGAGTALDLVHLDAHRLEAVA